METLLKENERKKGKMKPPLRKRPLPKSLAAAEATAKAETTPATIVPWRNTLQLYVHASTLLCARAGCLVCTYKIACFDVALDKEFTATWPNQRPETCPRLRTSSSELPCWPFCGENKRFLTVGDGDFSYSVALSRQLRCNDNNDSKAFQLTATSYESKATLHQVYRAEQLQSHWDELRQQGADLRFQIDATRLPDDLQKTDWDVVVWNFPCTAVGGGQDGQNTAMEENKALVRQFCQRIQAQEIHITHKTKPPFDQWGLVELVTSSDDDEDDNQNGASWTYVGRVVLDRALWQPYVPRKALDQKSFTCHDACTYIFQRRRNTTTKPWLHQTCTAVTVLLLQELRDYWMAQTPKLPSGTRRKHQKKRRHR